MLTSMMLMNLANAPGASPSGVAAVVLRRMLTGLGLSYLMPLAWGMARFIDGR